MDYKELLNAGKLSEALEQLQGEIRKHPAKQELRVFLFQLLCTLGNWDRALKQLQSIAKLSPDCKLLCQIYSQIILCEKLRLEVFSGNKAPLIFGEPASWIACITQASPHFAKKEFKQADELMKKAYAEAPAISGMVDGKPFEWIADGDSRLGPLLEIIINGNYYWMPFDKIDVLAIEKPQDLRDLIWVPVELKLVNGSELGGVIPVRYPGTLEQDDALCKISRKTDWVNPIADVYLGIGQKVFMTDSDEYSLLDIRNITLNNSTETKDG